MEAVRWRALPLALIMCVVYGGLLFGSAGRLDLPFFWALLAVFLAGVVTMILALPADLIRERMRPGPGAKERWIRPLLVVTFVSEMVVAGADVGRWHLTGTVPGWLQVAALVSVAALIGCTLWAQRVNAFFSSVVRIQHDRRQYVVTGGPYRYVRHPAYAAFSLMPLCTGLALGSWVAAAFVAPITALLIVRTRIEDRMLRAELPGYEAYAQRVRYRLLPGIW